MAWPAEKILDAEAPRHRDVQCPKCGTDVMVTGWVEMQQRRIMWMRFNCGPMSVSETPMKPVELLRAAE
jgi:hypothetical protein